MPSRALHGNLAAGKARPFLFAPQIAKLPMEIDFFWLIVAAAAAFTVRSLYRRIRYAHLLRRRRRTTSDRPVAVLYYVSQPLRY